MPYMNSQLRTDNFFYDRDGIGSDASRGPVLVELEAAPNGTMNGTVQSATTNTGGATTVHYGTTGLQFNITYDASVGSAPNGFVSTIASVIGWFQSHFTDPVTLNIDVRYGQ